MAKTKREALVELMVNMPMDKRCPRKLNTHAEIGLCPNALQKINAIRQFINEHGKYPSEVEENELPGCQFFANDHRSGYCVFAKFGKMGPNDAMSRDEIAATIMVDKKELEKIESTAMEKLKMSFTKEDIPDQQSGGGYTVYVEGDGIDTSDEGIESSDEIEDDDE
jgi:hypothetical protein